MGYNTVVVVRNDALRQIETDPTFGKKLVEAIGEASAHVNRLIEVPAGNHSNAVQVVECSHADTTILVAVGGALGEVKARTSGWRINDPEVQFRLLQSWADRLGYQLSKKPE